MVHPCLFPLAIFLVSPFIEQWDSHRALLPAELRKQVESAELKNQRLKEVFQTKIQEFRKVCYTLTGYQIDVTTESQYRLTSRYAEHQTDCLIFKVGSTVRASGSSGSSPPHWKEGQRLPRSMSHVLEQPHVPIAWSSMSGEDILVPLSPLLTGSDLGPLLGSLHLMLWESLPRSALRLVAL